MKNKTKVWSFLLAASVLPGPSSPASAMSNSVKALNYRLSSQSVPTGFTGTKLLPGAAGHAWATNKKENVRIKAVFSGLADPGAFGLAYMTYVLWAVTPEGRFDNLGELVIRDKAGALDVFTTLQTFGMIVTAEPYFAVTRPSGIVVLESAISRELAAYAQSIDEKAELMPPLEYAWNVAEVAPVAGKAAKSAPRALYQARNAVRIAKETGAEFYTPDSFESASGALQEAESYVERIRWYRSYDKEITAAARQAVQTAEDARLISLERKAARQKELAGEETAQAQKKAALETRGRVRAESGQAAAEKAQASAEAARAAAVKGERAALAEAGQARQTVRNSEAERLALRALLLKQLSVIFETRDTARGLIVSMPNVLFKTGKYDLKAPAREKLAKMAGATLAHPGLKLEVEGYTDDTGTKSGNQLLSEKRAGAVRAFLIEQGLSPELVSAQGLGMAMPLASNDDAAGREMNRRVEIAVSGEIIGTAVQATRTSP